MLFNIINSSDVRPGDHLYRYRWFKIQEGIAVQCSKISPILILTSSRNTLRLLTLKEFTERSCLRRVIYEQSSSCFKRTKSVCNRPPEEVVQNALLLLEWIRASPDRVRALFANDLSQFARQCCTTVHEQWRHLFQSTTEQSSSKAHLREKEERARKSRAFNAALLCGMPFRQASQIGKEEFWKENCSSQETDNDLFETRNTTNDTSLTFSPTSDETVCLI